MLNNKGTTLIELIISIALISVVLLFMVKLLVDLNNTQTNSEYAKDNQINRAEIIRMVSNDLNNNVITNINDNGSTQNKLIINFSFKSGKNSKIEATKNTFVYTNSADITRKWTIVEGEIYPSKALVYYDEDNKSDGKNFYALQIDIEVHTINEKNKLGNNNTLDDIIISYIGLVDDFSGLNCLGDGC